MSLANKMMSKRLIFRSRKKFYFSWFIVTTLRMFKSFKQLGQLHYIPKTVGGFPSTSQAIQLIPKPDIIPLEITTISQVGLNSPINHTIKYQPPEIPESLAKHSANQSSHTHKCVIAEYILLAALTSLPPSRNKIIGVNICKFVS